MGKVEFGVKQQARYMYAQLVQIFGAPDGLVASSALQPVPLVAGLQVKQAQEAIGA